MPVSWQVCRIPGVLVRERTLYEGQPDKSERSIPSEACRNEWEVRKNQPTVTTHRHVEEKNRIRRARRPAEFRKIQFFKYPHRGKNRHRLVHSPDHEKVRSVNLHGRPLPDRLFRYAGSPRIEGRVQSPNQRRSPPGGKRRRRPRPFYRFFAAVWRRGT